MITVATQIWDPNRHSKSFSSFYDESWVEKLYRGFARNLTVPFEFVCFSDRERSFNEPIRLERLSRAEPNYGDTIEAYRLGVPMIKCGLDTVVVGNIDHFAEYCLTQSRIALPRAVYRANTVCNGVALVPAGHRHIYDSWRGENDMEHLRRQDYVVLDEVFPGHAVSYKGRVKQHGLGDARIVFFHGEEKPHQLNADWIKESWK